MSLISLISSLGNVGFGRRSSAWAAKTFTGKSLVFCGDSITRGYATTTPYTSLLSAALSATEVNHGIDSSTMEKRTPIDPLTPGVNMLDRLSNIPTFSSSYGLLVFAFGMNDWGYNGSNYTPANFIADYTTAINNALSKGWAKQDILIIAPTYPLDAAFAFYANASGNAAPTRQRMLDFQQACMDIAFAKDVNICKPYDAMEGGTGLWNGDGVHPNNAGHALMSNTVYNFLTV